MVKLKSAIVALLAAGSIATASDSGVYSFRAQRSFDSGKFAKGYNQLERALLASRKEADLLSEGRVLIAMAQIRTMSLDLDFADSLLSVVHEDVLDKNTKTQYTKGKIALMNAREKYSDAAKICGSFDKEDLKKVDDATQAAFYGECAIAEAASRNNDRAQESLKMVGKRTDKKSGYYTFISARMADLAGSSDADFLYRSAEEKSIKANKPYNTASILYYRSLLKTTPKKEAAELKARCKNAFELMGLPNNAKRCAK